MTEASLRAIANMPRGPEREAVQAAVTLYALRRVEVDLPWFIAEVRAPERSIRTAHARGSRASLLGMRHQPDLAALVQPAGSSAHTRTVSPTGGGSLPALLGPWMTRRATERSPPPSIPHQNHLPAVLELGPWLGTQSPPPPPLLFH